MPANISATMVVVIKFARRSVRIAFGLLSFSEAARRLPV